MPQDVFIAHASADARIAMRLARAIEARNWHCWLMARDFRGGIDGPPLIDSAVRQSRVIAVILFGRSLRVRRSRTRTGVREGFEHSRSRRSRSKPPGRHDDSRRSSASRRTSTRNRRRSTRCSNRWSRSSPVSWHARPKAARSRRPRRSNFTRSVRRRTPRRTRSRRSTT